MVHGESYEVHVADGRPRCKASDDFGAGKAVIITLEHTVEGREERLLLKEVPKAFQGLDIQLVMAPKMQICTQGILNIAHCPQCRERHKRLKGGKKGGHAHVDFLDLEMLQGAQARRDSLRGADSGGGDDGRSNLEGTDIANVKAGQSWEVLQGS